MLSALSVSTSPAPPHAVAFEGDRSHYPHTLSLPLFVCHRHHLPSHYADGSTFLHVLCLAAVSGLCSLLPSSGAASYSMRGAHAYRPLLAVVSGIAASPLTISSPGRSSALTPALTLPLASSHCPSSSPPGPRLPLPLPPSTIPARSPSLTVIFDGNCCLRPTPC